MNFEIHIRRASVKVSVLFAIVTLASCAVVSTDSAAFAQKAKTEVRKGMSHSEVQAILGRPGAITTYDSTENWHYSKVNARTLIPLGLGGSEAHAVTVSFDSRGVVSSIRTGSISTPGAF
jgi:outer membrane protein assembly factor BamE (lipoprotein component of BamABCDE complex)